MASRGRKREKKTSVEDIYCNKNFVPPKEQTLETIFEEPRQSKDGVPILTSVKKYKRYLHFDPTPNKMLKRKRNAKKCANKLKNAYSITRSSPKNKESNDISLYMLGILGDSSSDNDMDISVDKDKTFPDTSFVNVLRRPTTNLDSTDTMADFSCSDVFDTPKRKNIGPKSSSQSAQFLKRELLETETVNPSNEATDNFFLHEVQESPQKAQDSDSESPIRSCIIS